jgi:hypothetical protein
MVMKKNEKMRLARLRWWKERTLYGQNALGKKFGHLTVIRTPGNGGGNYTCRCDCGRVTTRNKKRLAKKGANLSCIECLKDRNAEALINRSRNGFTVTDYVKEDRKFQIRCDKCGTNQYKGRVSLTGYLFKKEKPFCTLCSGRRIKNPFIYQEEARSLTGWAKELGVTRERVRQLRNKGKLAERISELRSRKLRTGK